MGGILYYGKYTREQIDKANQVDLEELLRRQGEKLIRSGRDHRLESDHSVTVRGNRWFDHASDQGGYALSFVRRHYHLSFNEAMELLTGEKGQAPLPIAKPRNGPPKEFVLPPASSSMRRVFGYLLGTRKLDQDVLTAFVREKLIYEDLPYHNAVFVGTDEKGAARHAHKRSTNSDGKQIRLNVEGCDPAYSFHWNGHSGKFYVFEAPIDLLSYISLYPEGWKENSYVALCGVSDQAMMKQLEQQPEVHEVFLCLDNDKAGHTACARLTEQLHEQGDWKVERVCPQNKDWNDDLRESFSQEQNQEGGMSLAL